MAIVKTLDHLVLTCQDVSKTIAWYETHLGMRAEAFGTASSGGDASQPQQRIALKYGSQKINLHQAGKEFEPKAKTALPGTADLCFEVEESVKLEEVLESLRKDKTMVFEAGGDIVERTGAKGKMRSVYVRDPDGNLIE